MSTAGHKGHLQARFIRINSKSEFVLARAKDLVFVSPQEALLGPSAGGTEAPRHLSPLAGVDGHGGHSSKSPREHSEVGEAEPAGPRRGVHTLGMKGEAQLLRTGSVAIAQMPAPPGGGLGLKSGARNSVQASNEGGRSPTAQAITTASQSPW